MKLAKLMLGAALAVSVSAGAAFAQDFPSRPISIIVPSAGTVTDIAVRFLAPFLQKHLGQPIVVENRPGAGGIIAIEAGAAAAPDGYTMVVGSSGPMVTYPYTHKQLSYDPQKTFDPVHGMSSGPLILAVNAASPFNTFKDLVDHAKANPDALNYATVGIGSAQHFTTLVMMKEAGVTMSHIPYAQTAVAVTDLAGGTLDLMFDFATVLKPQVDAGKLRILGVAGAERLSMLPDVPTFGEQGYDGIRFSPWTVMMVPAGTPPEVIKKLSDAMTATYKEPEVIEYHNKVAASVMTEMGPEETKAFIAAELAKMKDLVAAAGIEAK
jgi:tripartite-type tricarboxylate transporter receptor subunit TctC